MRDVSYWKRQDAHFVIENRGDYGVEEGIFTNNPWNPSLVSCCLIILITFHLQANKNQLKHKQTRRWQLCYDALMFLYLI